MILAHIASSRDSNLQPNLAKRALFIRIITSALFSPISPLSFGLHNTSQPTRWIFFSLADSPRHTVSHTCPVPYELDWSLWTCIWKTLVLLITNLARLTRPALNKHLVFQPFGHSHTFCSSMLSALLLRPRCWMWCPKYPAPMLLGLRCLNSTAAQLDQRDSKRRRQRVY